MGTVSLVFFALIKLLFVMEILDNISEMLLGTIFGGYPGLCALGAAFQNLGC